MTALANILTSDRLKVNAARQVRAWSGTLYDDKDFEEGYREIIPIYGPPESAKDKTVSKEFGGPSARGKRPGFHSATQNAAFSVNVPRFDVRHQLKDIKVNEYHDSLISLYTSGLYY